MLFKNVVSVSNQGFVSFENEIDKLYIGIGVCAVSLSTLYDKAAWGLEISVWLRQKLHSKLLATNLQPSSTFFSLFYLFDWDSVNVYSCHKHVHCSTRRLNPEPSICEAPLLTACTTIYEKNK